MTWTLPIGAQPDVAGTRFSVWAVDRQRIEVVLYEGNTMTAAYPLASDSGVHTGYVMGARAGVRYAYRLDGGDVRPDPASRFQPEGVHGPSQVVDPAAFAWTDGDWRGLSLEDLIIYELHVGTATPEGTFDALIDRLDDIRNLGVTAIEIMPVADFPGERNWGYDGVNLFAPARAYGGPEGLRRLVNAAHTHGLAVILDVVYNHLGPDGNYLRQFSQAYFTDQHHTPWGEALNFDGPGSEHVRAFFIANALYWAHEYHIDGLRLDATHAIIDDSPTHILAELAARVRKSLPADRHFLLIAENENNDPNLIRESRTENQEPTSTSGFSVLGSQFSAELDGVWADDFHHQVRVALAGDRDGYYADYSGGAADIATTLRQSWFYIGQDSPHLKRPRGAPADDVPPLRFVYCIQNHDQIGNRALGGRLNHDIGLDAYRAASALLLLAPYTPLLFMGQEWAASSPFLYFTDHNPELGRLVTEGRRKEFAHFTAFSGEQVPDPQARETFLRSKLLWEERETLPHIGVLRLYHDLLRLRRTLPALRERSRDSFVVAPIGNTALALRRTGPTPDDALLLIVNLRGTLRHTFAELPETTPPDTREWTPLLDTEDTKYGGRGSLRIGAMIEIAGPGAILLGIQ